MLFKNCSISTKLLNLCEYTCPLYSLIIILISSGFIVISPVSFLKRKNVCFHDLIKEEAFCFIDFFFSIVFALLILLISIFSIIFLPWVALRLLFWVLEVDADIIDLKTSLFSVISIKCCNFSFQHYFNHVPKIVICCIFIFIRFNVYFLFGSWNI